MPRKPLPDARELLPGYETLEGTIRRVVREELRPLHELLEEAKAARNPEELIRVHA